ncbi:MAG: Cytidine and deoxycytidylate deaminase zinc-binding region [Candidatus Saccharibacteria bacterium]|nr:Cytidine and deoxycytidylate deaminase zinc-binding region [Candidatus Saccharibacteria bacterium]
MALYGIPNIEKFQGMEPLPGYPDINEVLELQYPGLKDIFDSFYSVLNAQPNWRDEIMFDRNEFPFEAAIAVPDENGRLITLAMASNNTRSSRGSLGHAETEAIFYGLKGEKHLPKGAVLLSSVEPCAMCATGFHNSGGEKVIFSAFQSDIRGKSTWVDDMSKPFRSEPESYSAKAFLLERNPAAVVIGGYRRQDALRYM